MKNKNIRLFDILIFLLLVAIACGIYLNIRILLLQKPQMELTKILPERKSSISQLINYGLYDEAVSEYEILLQETPSKDEKAGIAFQIAKLSLEKLKDYKKAVKYATLGKELTNNDELQKKLNKIIIASLEQIGNSLDSLQVLSETTDLNNERKIEKWETVVAKVGNKVITMDEIKEEMKKLPPEAQKEFATSREKRISFVRDYVVRELLYGSAVRQGMDKSSEFLRQIDDIKKTLLISKVLENKLGDFSVSEMDIKNYYLANKERYKDKDGKIMEFEAIKEQVKYDLVMEKKKEKYMEIVNNLWRAEKIELYEDKIK